MIANSTAEELLALPTVKIAHPLHKVPRFTLGLDAISSLRMKQRAKKQEKRLDSNNADN